MTSTPRSFACQEDYEDSDANGIMKKRSFRRSEPTRGEPCCKVAKNVSQEQTADIPLTPDGLLRCRVKTWNDRKCADLRQFWEDRQDGGQLKPTKTGIMLNSVEWEHLCDALPELQAALVSQNTNFQGPVFLVSSNILVVTAISATQVEYYAHSLTVCRRLALNLACFPSHYVPIAHQVNMSQMRSASVRCDEEGPYVDVREFTWKLNSHRNFGRGNREPTERGIELGKSSLRALSHAAAIISSMLPGCADPPSPPKTARVYKPVSQAPHGPSDGVNHPSPGTDFSSMESPSPTMHAGNPYPENSLTYSNYGAGVRAANAMHAAHSAYQIVSPSVGGPQVGYGPSEAVQGIGKAMHNPASCHLHPSATPRGVEATWDEPPKTARPHHNVEPLQPHWEFQSMPIPPGQGLPGW